jgi:hypothetical protein
LIIRIFFYAGYFNITGTSESIALLLCSCPCWNSVSALTQLKVFGAIFSIVLTFKSTLACCWASLYFYCWGLVQVFRFYLALMFQREIRKAHSDFEMQEQIRNTGGDGRGLMQRFASNFSNYYSAQRVNERNYADASSRVTTAKRMAGAECCGCWVPDLSSNHERDPSGFHSWANLWVAI